MPEASITPHQNVGFIPWVTVQCGLPHSRQTTASGDEETEYRRRNGNARLVMTAQRSIGLPYGKVPRLILANLVRQYLIQSTSLNGEEARTIDLGRSNAEFLRRCGMTRSGGKYGSAGRIRDQLNRLARCNIEDEKASTDLDGFDRVAVVESMRVWWLPNPATVSLFPSYIRLSPGFAKSLEHAVPVDLDVMIALRSPFQIDLYAWLSYRAGGMHSKGQRRALISWAALHSQFGHGYARECDFRKAFRRHLRVVINHYPVRVEADHLGVVVFARAPHVGQRRNQ